MIRGSKLIAVLAIILGVGVPSLAQAAIVETIIDPDTDATLGSITFPAFTGDSDAGVLFSYGGFTQADITSISWTISGQARTKSLHLISMPCRATLVADLPPRRIAPTAP